MEEGILERIGKLKEKERVQLYKKLLVFLFFLFVAAVFWLLSALNREYTDEILYPVKYTNLPEDKILVNDLPESLILKVSGHGYSLLKYQLSKRLLPIVFDVNSFALNAIEDSISQKFYVLSRVARTRIASQISSDINILEIQPDSLVFEFSNISSKKLPVYPVLNLGYEQQFMLKGQMSIKPDTVRVSGPRTVIDTMQAAYTNELTIERLKETMTRTVGFVEIPQVRYENKRVSVSIPVEQFTEASIRVHILPVNVPEGLTLKLFPATINVFYHVALSDYDKIQPQHFMAIADYKEIERLNPLKINVQLTRFPDYILILRKYPESVDYIVEK